MAVNMRVTLTDNTDLVRQATEDAIQRALERVGLFVEGAAKIELENGYSTNGNKTGGLKQSPTGALKNSITHTVKGRTVIVGTNLKYGIYVHEGTGKYNSSGSTGDKYWVYVLNGNQSGAGSGKRYTYQEARRIVAILKSKGFDAHMTNGMKPNRFLKNAIMNNLDRIKKDVEKTLRGEQ